MMWIALGVAGVAVAGALAVHALRQRIRAASAAIAQAGPIRHGPANFFGLQSAGRAQIRGNGVLAIAGGDLRFEQYVPRRTLTVSLRSVTEVAIVRSFLGKRTVHDLVMVRWVTPDGSEDRAAWAVKDVPAWIEAIGNA